MSLMVAPTEYIYIHHLRLQIYNFLWEYGVNSQDFYFGSYCTYWTAKKTRRTKLNKETFCATFTHQWWYRTTTKEEVMLQVQNLAHLL